METQLRGQVAEMERTGQGTATVERLLKAGSRVERTPGGTQIILDGGIDRLRSRGLISQREFDAGHRYRSDALDAAVDPGPGGVDWNNVGANFGPKIPSMFASQKVADARLRWREANDRLGEQLQIIIELVVVKDYPLQTVGGIVFRRRNRRDAIIAGHTALVIGLRMLAFHYEHSRAS